jgi:hypothetical protein
MMINLKSANDNNVQNTKIKKKVYEVERTKGEMMTNKESKTVTNSISNLAEKTKDNLPDAFRRMEDPEYSRKKHRNIVIDWLSVCEIHEIESKKTKPETTAIIFQKSEVKNE